MPLLRLLAHENVVELAFCLQLDCAHGADYAAAMLRRPRNYSKHNPAKFNEVKERLQSDASLREIQRQSGIPKSTVWRWSKQTEYRPPGAAPLMPRQDELKFIASMRERDRQNIALGRRHASKLAASVLQARQLRFKNTFPTRSWFRSLFKRHQTSFRLRKPSRLKNPLTMTEIQRIEGFMQLLEQERIQEYLAECVLNLDETMVKLDAEERVFSEAPGSQRVRGEEPQWSGHVTLVSCVGADGARFPPCFIFKGKKALPELVSGCRIASVGVTGKLAACLCRDFACQVCATLLVLALSLTVVSCRADSGYINGPLFERLLPWLEPFFPKRRPLVLFVDQHQSRFSEGVLDFCKRKGIKLFALPPGLTHIMQPLDISVHRSYKAKLNAALTEFLSDRRVLRRANVVEMQYAAWDESFSADNIRAGFAAPGLWPFNPKKFLTLPDIKRVLAEHERQQTRLEERTQAAAAQPAEVPEAKAEADKEVDAALAMPPPKNKAKKRRRRAYSFPQGGDLTSPSSLERIRHDRSLIRNRKGQAFHQFWHPASEPEPDSEQNSAARPRRRLIRLSERSWQEQRPASPVPEPAAAEPDAGSDADSEDEVPVSRARPRPRPRKRRRVASKQRSDGPSRERKEGHYLDSDDDEPMAAASESDVPEAKQLNQQLDSRCANCRASLSALELLSASRCSFCASPVHAHCGGLRTRRAAASQAFLCQPCRSVSNP